MLHMKLIVLMLLTGCAARIDNPCEAFDRCADAKGSLVTCIDGECSCMLAVHEGENSPVSCREGER